MRWLLVEDDSTLSAALALQLRARNCPFDSVAPAALDAALSKHQEVETDELLVLDCASHHAIQSGRADYFPLTAFQRAVDRCAERGWPLLLVSDSRVFPLGGKQRFRESDDVQPAVAAGELLVERERYLSGHLPAHVILRSGPLLAETGDNLLSHWLLRLRAGGAVTASDNPRFCPTPADDVARVIAGIGDQLSCAAQCWGVFHYHSADAASGYEFVEVLLAAAAQYWNVGGDHVQLTAVAAEPFGGVFPLLHCQRIRDTFGIQQLPWRKAIPALLKQIYRGEVT